MIEGDPGSGKSRLALMLVGQGGELVADDRTLLWADGGALYARAPGPIAGLIEVRGLGLIRLAARRLARVRLVVGLSDAPPPRLPAAQTCTRAGCEIAWIAGQASEAFARGLALMLRGRAGGPAQAAF